MTGPGWVRALPDGKPISALGFGCSSLWAKPGFDEARAQAVLETAVAEGVNHFDTSPSYGPALGEERLGRFIAARGARDLVVSTKVGNNLVDGAIRRGFALDDMRRSLDGSLRRLGLDRVDIVYLHGPTVAELMSDNVARFLAEEKAAGRIGFAGVESRSPDVIAAAADAPVDAVMPHYNAGNPAMSELFEPLSRTGKFIVSGTTLAQMAFDLRTFLPTNRRKLWYLLRIAKNDPLFWWRGPRLARALRRSGKSPHEAAIAFVIANPYVISGLFGSSNPDHVAANARAGRRSAAEAGNALRRTVWPGEAIASSAAAAI